MSKFQPLDIVVSPNKQTVLVILGEHVFPNKELAYRTRSCLPQILDMTAEEDGEEYWTGDGYHYQNHIDNEFTLIYRVPK